MDPQEDQLAGSSRSETLRDNERFKHLAGAITAWANALVIGSFGRMILDRGLDFGSVSGVLLGFAVIWVAFQLLTMLVAEGEI